MSTDSMPRAEPGALFRRILGRIGVELRPGEGLISCLLFAYFMFLIGAQYISKSVRDSEFVTTLDADNLPYGFILVAICSYPLLRLFSRLVDRLPRHHVIAATSGVFAASLVLFWWLFQFPWLWVPVVYYVWHSILSVMTVSQFWSYANHSYDPRQAKRLFGFIGAGGLLGGFAGGQFARLAEVIGTGGVLLVAAGVTAFLAVLVYVMNALHTTDEAQVAGAAGLAKLDEARGGFEAIKASRHLTLIALLMLLTIAVANIVDLQYKWAVTAVTTGLDERTATFGLFDSLLSISGFVFQVLFVSRIHRRLGVGVAMRILPVAMGLGTIGLLFTPVALINVLFVVAVTLRVMRYSIDQATRELLFLPVPSKARLKAKAYIDVFVQRFAKGFGAVFVLIGTTVLGLNIAQVGWFTIGLIVVWLAVTVAMRRQFVVSFREGLRRREVNVAVPLDLSDATSLELIVQSLGSADESQVLHALGMLEFHDKHQLVPPVLLRHASPAVRAKALEIFHAAGREEVAPWIEKLLADDDAAVQAAAMRALVALRSENARELLLPHLGDESFRLRAVAAASVLLQGEGEDAERAADSLRGLLRHVDADARISAAGALAELDEPSFQEELVQLLADPEQRVQAAAIGAVRNRVERGGDSPLFVPALISLMRDRRLKHDAREALVAYGGPVIPALVHFMNDEEEQLWVRRAIPKTIARIGGREAVTALVDNLQASDDFLRRKVVEALVWQRTRNHGFELSSEELAVAIQQEARRYFLSLTDLVSIGGPGIDFLAPVARIERGSALLVERLLAERMQQHVDIIFGMLALDFPVADIRAAHAGLSSERPGVRNYAIEYLDNILSGDIHKAVFAVINDEPLGAKVRLAQSTFDLAVQPAADVLRRLVIAARSEEEGAMWMGAAAIHAICEDKLEELYPQLAEAAHHDQESIVRETANWAMTRLGPALGRA